MRKSLTTTAAALILLSGVAHAQEASGQETPPPLQRDSVTTAGGSGVEGLTFDPVDTISLRKIFILNDYSMFGVEYGPAMHMMQFTPEYKRKSFMTPVYAGITYTRYYKMFGYMPYFGYQIGLFYGSEGYEFKENKDTGGISTIEGATKAVYKLVEVPFLLEGHADFQHFKIIADIGPYAGYRFDVTRTGPSVTEGLENAMAGYEHKWDYGLHGAVGFALVFEPLEFYVRARLRYSWSSLYDPDYYDPEGRGQYYYRYAYPMDVMVTGGISVNITKRTGRTKKDLRKEAWEAVNNPQRND